MANCKYCGKGAGLFKDVHPECEQLHEREEAESLAREKEAQAKAEEIKTILISHPSDSTEEVAVLLDRAAGNDLDIVRRGVVEWFRYLVSDAELDNASQARVEALVRAILDRYHINGSDLPDKVWGKFVRICACGDIDRGVLPTRVNIAGNLPFNTETGETVVWVFPGVEYLEFKTVRSSTRGYGGVSVRYSLGCMRIWVSPLRQAFPKAMCRSIPGCLH